VTGKPVFSYSDPACLWSFGTAELAFNFRWKGWSDGKVVSKWRRSARRGGSHLSAIYYFLPLALLSASWILGTRFSFLRFVSKLLLQPFSEFSFFLVCIFGLWTSSH